MKLKIVRFKNPNFSNFSRHYILNADQSACADRSVSACTDQSVSVSAKLLEYYINEFGITRNPLRHLHSIVDYSIVWDVIKNKIPELNEQINSILNTENNLTQQFHYISHEKSQNNCKRKSPGSMVQSKY